jgi:predicted NUDIX family NTP pyrophosphohydrolase
MLAHMGGPFWAKKDVGGWSIPKGEYSDSDEPLDASLLRSLATKFHPES